MTLAERLKATREALGHEQKSMATLLSISFRSWQDYELGKSVPGGKVFEALAKQGIDTNWLLTGEGPMRRGEGTDDPQNGKTVLQSVKNGNAVNGNVHIGIHGGAPASEVAVTDKGSEDPVATAFLNDWLSLSEVAKMRVWMTVKEELERIKAG
jgi:transcriptional regulator with XRE-family HTH domain